MRTVQGYGWRPSLPDARDLVADVRGMRAPREIDPRIHMTPVYDQGQLGSCTANAVAAALDFHRVMSGLKPFVPSRLALYACERLLEGQPLTADTGAFGRDGFKAAKKYGLISEALYPYSDVAPAWHDDPLNELAAAQASDSSANFTRLHSPYKAVPRSVAAFKRVLANGQTIAFGFSVYESFESEQVARSGVMPLPASNERLIGGHEVLLVGYLADHQQHCLVRNSWGTKWGDGGYFLMPWKVLLDRQMSGDLRTIYRPQE